MKQLKDILISESKRLNGFVYSSWPYSCGLTEALCHASKLTLALEPEIKREDKNIHIILKPRQGRRSRSLTISLWTI